MYINRCCNFRRPKEAEKILKYEDLTTEIHHMWNIKATVITGATGTISKSFTQYLSNILGKYEIKELQKKNIHTGHCTHTSESSNAKVQNTF